MADTGEEYGGGLYTTSGDDDREVLRFYYGTQKSADIAFEALADLFSYLYFDRGAIE